MSRNGSGTYNLPAGNPVVTGNTISSSWANTTLSDIASALTGSIAADGQTTPTANLVMGTYAHTGVGNATARTMYASAGQVQDSVLTYLTSVAGTNAITASAPIVMTAYVTGQVFRFIAAGASTGAVTININSIGLKSVVRTDGSALVSGDIASGAAVQIMYDGTNFQLLSDANGASEAFTNLSYTGTLTGGTGVVNLGSGQFYKDASGNLGIGTASPAFKLDVVGQIQSTSDVRVKKTGSDTVASGPFFYLNSGDGSNNGNIIQLNASNGLDIWNSVGGSYTKKLTLDTSGNLGLGVTPSAWQSTRKAYQVGVSSLSTINNNTFVGTNYYSDGTSKYIATNVALLYGQESSGAHTWYNAPSGTAGTAIAWTQAMTLDASGRLLVGTTSNAGYQNTYCWVYDTPNAAAYASKDSGSASGSVYWGFGRNGSAIGSITQNGTTAVAYNTSSDYRLKENIAPMVGALDKVALLKPVTYKWKSDGSDGQGFIAHELQDVIPDCVTGEKDATEEQEYEISPAIPAVLDEEGNEVTPAVDAVMGTRTVPVYQGIDTSFLVATLTAAIQELNAKFEEYKASHP